MSFMNAQNSCEKTVENDELQLEGISVYWHMGGMSPFQGWLGEAYSSRKLFSILSPTYELKNPMHCLFEQA